MALFEPIAFSHHRQKAIEFCLLWSLWLLLFDPKTWFSSWSWKRKRIRNKKHFKFKSLSLFCQESLSFSFQWLCFVYTHSNRNNLIALQWLCFVNTHSKAYNLLNNTFKSFSWSLFILSLETCSKLSFFASFSFSSSVTLSSKSATLVTCA